MLDLIVGGALAFAFVGLTLALFIMAISHYLEERHERRLCRKCQKTLK